jgi:glycerate kinase
VLHAVRFDEHARDANVVLTGEGRLDGQTSSGKVVSGVVAHVARLERAPRRIIFAGELGEGWESVRREESAAVVEITPPGATKRDAMQAAATNLENAVRRALA